MDLLVHRIPAKPFRRTGAFASFVLFGFLFAAAVAVSGCGENRPAGDSGSDSTQAAAKDSLAEETIGEAVEAEKDERYSLRLTPKAGDVYSYSVTRSQSRTTEGFKSTQEETYDFSLRVVSVNDDKSMVLGMTYNRIRAKATAPAPKADSTGRQPIRDSAGGVRLFEQTITFDTQGKNDVPGGERYRAFVGRETLVTLGNDGKVQDVANVDPILNATLKELKVSGDTLNPRALDMAKQGIRFEIGTLVSLLFFQLPPDTAVAVGASWSQTDSIPIAGGLPAKTTYTYTLSGLREAGDERLAEVNAVLKTQASIPKKSIDNEYISMKIESVNVTGSGQTIVSTANGFPVSKKSAIQAGMSGVGSAKQGPDKGKTEKVTYKESTTTSIRRLSYKPGA